MACEGPADVTGAIRAGSANKDRGCRTHTISPERGTPFDHTMALTTPLRGERPVGMHPDDMQLVL